jgi:amino acid transporter
VRKMILTYGTIAGVVIMGSFFLGVALDSEGSSWAALEWLGYLTMIVALSMIFLAVKRYRDQELGGVIKFGTAFKLGLGISLVASAIYVVSWEANLAFTDYAFIGEYTESVLQSKRAEGVEGAELVALEADMAEMRVNYAKPWYRLPMTFAEIFPVGLLISLLSAALLRNSRLMPARGTTSH